MSSHAPATLDDFLARLRDENPFLINRVDRPLAGGPIDVPAINAHAFHRILALGRQAHRENRGIGVVVWGEAGVGKSHLLGRLGRWADQDRHACHVYLHNLQASPERLPRYVLRSIFQALTRGRIPPLHHSPLSRLLTAALRRGLKPGTQQTWETIAAGHQRLVARLAAEDPSQGVLFDHTVHEILFRFLREAHPSMQGRGDTVADLAVRWLAGEVLEPAEARLLGLPPQRVPDDPVALADNQHVKQVLVALTQLARAAGRLLLVCFDQVDNLDEIQVKALTRFLHDLLDSSGNLLVVTTGVQQTMLGYLQRGVITETSWDRVGQFELALGRLRREQGWELLRARLRPFLEPFRGLAEVDQKVREDGLFPLGSAWFEGRVRDLSDFRPRDLIGWACERWGRLQEALEAAPGRLWLERWPEEGEARVPPATELSPEEQQGAITREVQRRLAYQKPRFLGQADLMPADEDHLLGLLETTLDQCRGGRYALRAWHRVQHPKGGRRGPYDLILEQQTATGQTLRLGVRVLVAEHGRSVFAALTRIVEDEAPPGRILLVTDARQEMPFGDKGGELLEELKQRGPGGFQHVVVSREELAGLEALQAVVRLARAGDFEVEMAPGPRRAVTEDEVIASYHRDGRYLALPLLRELLGGEARPVPGAAPAPEGEGMILERAPAPQGAAP
ncbi:MAG: ATP-binding protein [Gemmataceae bacterium]|nr:ATP-binding protein [Gemmataceae bacterium]